MVNYNKICYIELTLWLIICNLYIFVINMIYLNAGLVRNKVDLIT